MEAVPQKTTIRDVARAAGVGVGTISRVLNSSSQVSRETRARVLKAIRRLGFRPNAQARRILRRRSETVCFLLSNRDFLHPFHARILQGVESYASSLKQHVLFAALHYSPRIPAEKIDLPHVLQEHGLIDGVILAGTIYPNVLRRIESIHMPYVALSNNVVGMDGRHEFDQVGFDDFNATLQATRYLISEGHSEIVFAGDTSFPWFQRRFDGYRQVMRENKLKPVLVTARNAESFVAFGQKIAQRILSRRPRPTAVVAGNDETAYGLWLSLRRHAVKVPDDVSLVGFDDREEAMLMDPPLTTVRVHKEEIGQTCMKMLLERLHNPHMAFSQRILPTEFVVRGTVLRLRDFSKT
ncbi:MAG TPA: LacI family DNA-binding transcriptional regulator [Candidatus Dormibacteraeota bacterium]|jgi:LacI family transcriptional regulator|nr:LacI family DNA-binding transcriptional regulator [Candidatus Dormibacteraeota bacterium]